MCWNKKAHFQTYLSEQVIRHTLYIKSFDYSHNRYEGHTRNMDFSLIHIHMNKHTHLYIYTKCHQTVNCRADPLMLVCFGSCCEFMLRQSGISEKKVLDSLVHHKLCFSSCHVAVDKKILFQTQGHGYRNTWNACNCSWKWCSVSSMCLQMLYKLVRRMNRAWKWSRRWAVIGCSKYSNSCKTVTVFCLTQSHAWAKEAQSHNLVSPCCNKIEISNSSYALDLTLPDFLLHKVKHNPKCRTQDVKGV
jgi:hypothetical protein